MIHSFPSTIPEARKVQDRLRGAVRCSPIPLDRIRLVGAADATFIGEKDIVAAAFVVADFRTGRIVEERTAACLTRFPYVPGYLAFREGPAIVASWNKLSRKPDAVLFEGQGVAHPRRIGIASHLGVLLNVCSVGCARNPLVGEFVMPGPRKGDWTPLSHEGETVGAVLRTRNDVKPVFVSVGHRADLPSAIALVLRLCSRYRLPDIARRAHQLTQEIRKTESSGA